MIRKLEKGDRLRIRSQRRVSDYRPGDRGTVISGPKKSVTGETYYIARMDKNGPEIWTFFAAEDVEPEA
jgi:hypothetical protein